MRLFQRELLHDPRVQAALRWRGDDPDSEVRRVAFLLSLYTREKLLRALRERDPELQRQLAELESGSLPALEASAPKPAWAEAPSVAEPANLFAAGALQELSARLEELASQGRVPKQTLEQLRFLQQY